jgi:hypothetical protein
VLGIPDKTPDMGYPGQTTAFQLLPVCIRHYQTGSGVDRYRD